MAETGMTAGNQSSDRPPKNNDKKTPSVEMLRLQALVRVAAAIRGVDQETSFQSSLLARVERIDLGAVHEAEQDDAQACAGGTLGTSESDP